MAKDPSPENIELFSDLEEQFRENGGYEAESIMSRLADGLGLRQELLLEDIESLSGGQRRRVDLIRILFQGPDTMILDEPTNHLDLPAKRWLMEELERFPGAILVVSHDLKLLDRSINKVLHLSDGRLHEFKGTYSSYMVQLEADQSPARAVGRARGPGDQAPVPPGRLHAGQHRPSGPDRQIARQAGRATRVVEDRGRTSARGRARSASPPRHGRARSRSGSSGPRGPLRRPTVLRDVDFHCRRGDRVVVIGRNGAGKSSLLRCLAGVQEPDGRTGRQLGANVTLGYFAQEHEQVDLDGAPCSRTSTTPILVERDRTSGPARLVRNRRQGRPPDAEDPVGRRAGQARPGHAGRRPGQRPPPRRAHQQPRPLLDRGGRHHAEPVARAPSWWSATTGPSSSALEPTHALKLPDEIFTHWDDDFLDQVEMK